MRTVLQRLPVERAVHAVVALTIFAFVCGSSSIPKVTDYGRHWRWGFLVALLVVAAIYALARRERPAFPLLGLVLAAMFVSLAFTSTLWSVDRKLTFLRTGTLTLLLAASALLAYAAAGRPRAVRGLLVSIIGGVALAALAGLVVLAWRSSYAVVPATTQYPERYQGLGGNPNTVPLLIAFALPLTAWQLLSRKGAYGRAGAGALFLLFLGTVIASGSRVALVAGFCAIAVASWLTLERARARVVATLVAASVFVLSVLLTQVPKPLRAAPTSASTAALVAYAPRQGPFLDADRYRRLEDDVGHPPFGKTGATIRRTLFGSSGRSQAWAGAIDQALDRPVVGYGFGTEDKVFADRYVSFDGRLAENSYIGVFLQLGAIGAALFLLVLAAIIVEAARRLRGLRGERRAAAGACAAVVCAGVIVAVGQSYAYSTGNVGTSVFWLCAFLLAAAVGREAVVDG